MEVKLFEVRDRATYIAAIGISVEHPRNEAEHYMMRRAGYPLRPDCGPLVLFGRIDGGQLTCDPYDNRCNTMRAAHAHVADNWRTLESGDVVDVEYIRGDTTEPKRSEQLFNA